jgi:Phosphodiester glycosidase/FlgD Ig-like domain
MSSPRRPLLLAAALIAVLSFPAGSGAQARVLWPGVTYERGVQFTPNGPVAISILRGPRPGGTTSLEPLLSNESLLGRETLTAMQKRLAPAAVTAGVNGDFFTLATGRPSGVLMRDGVLVSPPRSARSSAGITSDGRLDIRRVSFFGSWQGSGAKHPLTAFNQVPEMGQVALFTDTYGPFSPLVPGATVVILFPFPEAVPNLDLGAVVGEVRASGASVEIPAGGAVLLARGSAATALVAEALPDAAVTVRLQLRPDWPGVVAAIGGGPQIVRGGAPVFQAGEEFTSSQLGPRAPRTGVGQLRNGRIILVAVDGRQPGRSIGLTNFELAQTLVRLGAVSAMALDSGGSTTMAFDGTVLNTPSDGSERRISTALVLAYRGVYLSETPARISPNGDGVDDAPALTYRVLQPSAVKTRLLAPDGSVAAESVAQAEPGAYPVAFPPAPAATVEGTDPSVGAAPPALGPWRLIVEAVDELGRATSMTRSFVLDDTLGFLRVPRRVTLVKGAPGVAIAWRQARPAKAIVTILDSGGEAVRTLALGELEAGERAAVWDGLGRGRKAAAAGTYTIRVATVGPVGRSELSASLQLRRTR